jgi:membrane-associated protease RseP (regulator of RpoE activity)
MKCTFWQVLTIALCASVPQTTRAQTKEGALETWATALGGRKILQNVQTIHIRGSVETGGLKGTYERWSTSRGEFRTALDLAGAIRQVTVFDGQRGWIEMSGTVQELSGAVLKAVISGAYEASNSFLFAGRMPGRVELPEPYVIRLESEGGNPVTVYLDPQTGLPSREESGGPLGTRVVRFSDWREFSGIQVPGTIRQSNGGSKDDAVIRTEQVEINAPVPAGLFEKPGDSAPAVRFATEARQAEIPVQIYAEHVLLPVRVNGGEPGWFFLDSGASASMVSKAWAEKNALSSAGAVRGDGAAGSTGVAFAKSVVLNLPGVDVPVAAMGVMDFSLGLPMFGRRWEGLVGYDVLSRVVVRIDYEHQKVTMYDPEAFVAPDGATSLPVTFVGTLAMVPVRILLPGRAPIDVKGFIDSGASGLTLSTPFTNSNHVIEAVPKRVSSSAYGAGGESTRFAGHIAGLQLGPHLLREPVAAFSTDTTEGLLASPEIGALIGGEILQRFTVTLDYPHRRIFFEPNGRFADPFPADTSGLSLLARGDDFRLFESDSIEPGSPAHTAGLRKGDRILAIGDRPAREFDLEQIHRVLEKSGKVTLTIERAGKILKLNLKLTQRL